MSFSRSDRPGLVNCSHFPIVCETGPVHSRGASLANQTVSRSVFGPVEVEVEVGGRGVKCKTGHLDFRRQRHPLFIY